MYTAGNIVFLSQFKQVNPTNLTKRVGFVKKTFHTEAPGNPMW